jgi:hypothetical protein
MTILRRWRQNERGVAAIEGAIVIFAFIFLIFTIMELLYLLFAYNSVVRASQNAARYAMLNSPNGCAWLEANVNDSVAHVGVIPVTITVGASDCTPGVPSLCSTAAGAALAGTVRIHGEYDFKSAGFFSGILASTVPIATTVCVPMIQ